MTIPVAALATRIFTCKQHANIKPSSIAQVVPSYTLEDIYHHDTADSRTGHPSTTLSRYEASPIAPSTISQ